MDVRLLMSFVVVGFLVFLREADLRWINRCDALGCEHGLVLRAVGVAACLIAVIPCVRFGW